MKEFGVALYKIIFGLWHFYEYTEWEIRFLAREPQCLVDGNTKNKKITAKKNEGTLNIRLATLIKQYLLYVSKLTSGQQANFTLHHHFPKHTVEVKQVNHLSWIQLIMIQFETRLKARRPQNKPGCSSNQLLSEPGGKYIVVFTWFVMLF